MLHWPQKKPNSGVLRNEKVVQTKLRTKIFRPNYIDYDLNDVYDISLTNEPYYICYWRKPNDVHKYIEKIYATDFADALDTAIKIIGRETGQSYDYCLSCILSLERSGIN